MSLLDWFLAPEAPGATIVIMLICFAIALANSTVNRLLISKFVGWQHYLTMQADLAEYRSQTTQALRSRDQKSLEKLKKKETEIMNMQKKMLKPQMLLFALSFSYIFIWLFVLGPTYGGNTVAFFPGLEFIDGGRLNVFYWYFICSFALGTIASRLLGIMRIE